RARRTPVPGPPRAGAHTRTKRPAVKRRSGHSDIPGFRRRAMAGLDRRPPMAHTRAVDTRALRWLDPPDGPAIVLLDQTRLPAEEEYLLCRDVAALDQPIPTLLVRGAALLGLAGAYGVALAAYRGDDVAAAADALGRSRPTAVNLSWGAVRALAAYRAARDAEPGDTAQGRRRAAAAALAQARAIEAAGAAARAALRGHRLGLVAGPGPHPDPLQHRCPGAGGRGHRVRDHPRGAPGGAGGPAVGG